MSVKWEKQEGNEGVLTVEVDAETFKTALDDAFKKVVKQVSIPGFRKGKIPRGLFEQRFGVEALYQDALDILLPVEYPKAVEEAGIEPVDRPEIDVEKIEKGESLIFTAKVTVKPEVKLGEYKGLGIEKDDTTVTDEDVQNELKALQERQAELVVKEEGAVEEGNTVVLDFEGFVDGEAFEGGKAENYSLEVGSGSFIPGFEDQLVGLEAGAEKDVEVTFPEEYHAEDLAGKPAVFKVKIHEIKAKELPELDDEFAKDIDEEVETLAELTEKTKKRLEEAKENEADAKLREELVLKASENAEIDVPQAMVDTELDRMLKEFEQRLQMQGMNLELYTQFSGQDEAALKEQMKEDAEKRVKSNLTLEAIAKAENLEVSDEEVDAELTKMAEAYNMPVENIKQAIGSTDAMKEDLKVRKAIDFLVENR
ncbi:trigger factor [Bacillus subtilis]|jgi:trigger factor|uniref:Trigger factor n=9 Tax=Bacilli TaxID=91061 RepID=TIG_BACSU|nr:MULTISPECIES: trigger factor [Bacillales]NP_390701.1 prolyl isomerase (trigger factor) [Bacillus subtilis subsp. subtilis str. 168]P80698.3 RecName: Full=Trigger factor; Short=TF; AltName: Full=PPIase; AltName: Full=Vegetative protein 2; Short=VEG2 [Bacillus subtilis subsp. subtilis str. 168]MDP4124178.1 trigger factor [Bacillota bacterium]BAM53259.1 trigger factor [Bacillus subtilis BEST7613]AFQ58669.1 Prolyl isomerase (trigger factor) [Bacillus subtilis QB928]AGG62229.1 prolyl isomerase 